MKETVNKRYILTAAIAMLLSVSCDRQEAVSIPLPIELDAVSIPNTRGYVESTEMEETAPAFLHTTGGKMLRDIVLTAWHYKAVGGQEEYFNSKVFSRGTDGLWHADPAVYWPMGATMDYLAYTCSVPFPAGSVKWDGGRSTDRVNFYFDRAYTQDDVLFSSAIDKKVTDAEGRVAMVFKHSQAWIQFRLHSKASQYDNIVKIDKIVLMDTYSTGMLTVSHPFGEAEGQWSFRYDRAEDTDVDDVHGVYGTWMTTTIAYLDMLLPEQPMKDIILFYSLSGTDSVMQYRFRLPVATWQMGKKYIYDISFAPHEIIIVPTVIPWEEKDNDIYIPEN